MAAAQHLQQSYKSRFQILGTHEWQKSKPSKLKLKEKKTNLNWLAPGRGEETAKVWHRLQTWEMGNEKDTEKRDIAIDK